MRLLKWILGTVVITLKGRDAALLLNRAAQNHITLSGLYYKDGIVVGNIRPRDFKRLFALRHGLAVQIHLRQKIGLPFLCFRYRRRYGFIGGILLFFSILLLLNSFIWVIEVEGNKTVSAQDILADCNRCGIYIGLPKNSIDANIAAQRLLLQNNALSWASINPAGCVITVDVQEIDGIIPAERQIGNLIAAVDGVITKINITAGNALVKPGDAVHKGDVLVSGLINHADRIEYVKAAGVITAKTTPVFTAKIDIAKPISVVSGKRRRLCLHCFGINISLPCGQITEPYKKTVHAYGWHLLGREMPIGVTVLQYDLMTECPFTADRETVLQMLREDIDYRIKKAKLLEINKINEELTVAETVYTLTETLSAQEDIAKFAPILVDSAN